MRKFVIIILLSICHMATAQIIPEELFYGNEKMTHDMLFFRYIKNTQGENSPWLFIHRNRLSVDYRMTETSYLPQFAITNAIAYHHKALKGFAPSVFTQIVNTGVLPKAGIFYARSRKVYNLFTYLSVKTWSQPNIDYAILVRYIPRLTDKMKLFTQFESGNAFPLYDGGNYSFIQRIRIGLSINYWQFGPAADYSQTGRTNFVFTKNIGAFLRYEF